MNSSEARRPKVSRFCLIVSLLLLFLGTCAPGTAPTPTAVTEPTSKPMPTPTAMAVSTRTPTPTPAPPTFTPTPTATATPQLVLSHDDFSFPVAFDGPYALDHALGYMPCYHWNGSYDYDANAYDQWGDFFHAGDQYILNLSAASQPVVILSPIDGWIQSAGLVTAEIGWEISITTDYFYDGKQVSVDIVHADRLFPGDEDFPGLTLGSYVVQGQPLAVQETVFRHGRLEQMVDIAIRSGPKGANPEYNNWAPESYIDPFPFLQDDLERLGSLVYLDYDYAGHCLQSGHFP